MQKREGQVLQVAAALSKRRVGARPSLVARIVGSPAERIRGVYAKLMRGGYLSDEGHRPTAKGLLEAARLREAAASLAESLPPIALEEDDLEISIDLK